MLKYRVIILFLFFSDLPVFGQKPDAFLSMSEHEVELLSNQIGDLFFSYQGIQINEFVAAEDFRFVTSLNRPNEVLIFNESNTLYQSIKFKGVNKKEFAGLYKVNGRIFYAQRPKNKAVYEIYKNGKFWKKRKIRSSIKDKRIYYSKTISTGESIWTYFDSYGLRVGQKRIKSAILREYESKVDTVARIPYEGGMNLMIPYSSWTFEIHFDNASKSIIAQNFSNSEVSIYSLDGSKKNEINIKSYLTGKNIEIGDIYFGGSYKYYSRVFTDDFTGELLLYTGGLTPGGKSHGILMYWDDGDEKWKEKTIPIKALSSFKTFPFVDVVDIHDSYLYFRLKVEGNKEGVYRIYLGEAP